MWHVDTFIKSEKNRDLHEFCERPNRHIPCALSSLAPPRRFTANYGEPNSVGIFNCLHNHITVIPENLFVRNYKNRYFHGPSFFKRNLSDQVRLFEGSLDKLTWIININLANVRSERHQLIPRTNFLRKNCFRDQARCRGSTQGVN